MHLSNPNRQYNLRSHLRMSCRATLPFSGVRPRVPLRKFHILMLVLAIAFGVNRANAAFEFTNSVSVQAYGDLQSAQGIGASNLSAQCVYDSSTVMGASSQVDATNPYYLSGTLSVGDSYGKVIEASRVATVDVDFYTSVPGGFDISSWQSGNLFYYDHSYSFLVDGHVNNNNPLQPGWHELTFTYQVPKDWWSSSPHGFVNIGSSSLSWGFSPTLPLPPDFKQFAGSKKDPPVKTTFADGSPIVGDWGDACLVGSTSSKDTLRSRGCVVTCVAMLLNYLGDKVDPGTFNTWLTAHRPNPNGKFNFAPLPSDVGQADGVPGPSVTFDATTAVSGGREAIVNQLQQLIEQHGPVILDVPSEAKGLPTYTLPPEKRKAHRILAYAVVGQPGSEKVLIRDPGHCYDNETPTRQVTLDQYVALENQKFPSTPLDSDYSWLTRIQDGIRWADIDTPSSTPKGHINGNSPIEFVITDALGHRLGNDPVHGLSYNEIPSSFYCREPAEAASEDFDEPSVTGYNPISAVIGQLIPGSYNVQVYGLDSGPWSMDFGVSDPNNALSFDKSSLNGIASAGSYEEFSMTISAVPEPSTLILSGIGAIGLFAWRRWTRTA
jgi:hypothetical protein